MLAFEYGRHKRTLDAESLFSHSFRMSDVGNNGAYRAVSTNDTGAKGGKIDLDDPGVEPMSYKAIISCEFANRAAWERRFSHACRFASCPSPSNVQ